MESRALVSAQLLRRRLRHSLQGPSRGLRRRHPLTHLAWLGGNLTSLATSNAWAAYRPADALIRPDQLWPDLGETSLLIGARILPVLALLALAAAGGLWWSRHKGTLGGNKKRRIEGTAKAKDIAPVLATAITEKARSLRLSLKDAQRIAPSDTGILLGNLQGSKTEVRMGWEDVAVAIMAPAPERPPRWRFPRSWPPPAPCS